MKTLMVIALLAITGCEYREMEVHEIETKDGKVIKLKCPMFKDDERFSVFVLSESTCYLTDQPNQQGVQCALLHTKRAVTYFRRGHRHIVGLEPFGNLSYHITTCSNSNHPTTTHIHM